MRLIDADNLVPDVCDAEIEYGTKAVHFSADAINNAPTNEAEPVVHCRDCCHFFEEGSWCEIHSFFYDGRLEEWNSFGKDDFCSSGELKKGERK